MGKLETKTETKLAKSAPLESVDVLVPDDILEGEDKLRAVSVSTHEWRPGSSIFVAELDADERDQLEMSWAEYKDSLGEEDSVGFPAFAVAFCLCDAKRYRMFADREASAAQKIRKRNGKTTRRLFNVISRINGLTRADVDDLEKN